MKCNYCRTWRSLCLCFTCALSYLALETQGQQLFDWATQATSQQWNTSTAVACSPTGTILQAGLFMDSITLLEGQSNSVLTGSGGLNSFIQCIDSAGTVLWAIPLLSDKSLTVSKLSVDRQGNAIVCGTFKGNAQFDPAADTALAANAGFGKSLFVARYTAAGKYDWHFVLQDTSAFFSVEPTAMALALDSSLWLAGSFQSPVDFDPGSDSLVMHPNGTDAFVAQYSSNGQLLQAFAISGSGEAQINGLDINSNGWLVVAGQFTDTVELEAGLSVVGNCSSCTSGFVAVYNSQLTVNWHRTLAGQGTVQCFNATVFGNNDEVYVGGTFSGNINFDPGSSNWAVDAPVHSQIFTASYDLQGNVNWVNPMVDSIGNQNFMLRSIAIDNNGNLLAAGAIASVVEHRQGRLGNQLLHYGGRDIFLAKYSRQSGKVKWCSSMGGTGTDEATGLAVSPTNDIYLTGSFRDSVDFDPGIPEKWLHCNPEMGASFLARFRNPILPPPVSSEPEIPCKPLWFPNPTDRAVHFETCKPSAIIGVYDLRGALLQQFITHSGVFDIDMLPYSEGLYLVSITTAEEREVHKIVLQR